MTSPSLQRSINNNQCQPHTIHGYILGIMGWAVLGQFWLHHVPQYCLTGSVCGGIIDQWLELVLICVSGHAQTS